MRSISRPTSAPPRRMRPCPGTRIAASERLDAVERAQPGPPVGGPARPEVRPVVAHDRVARVGDTLGGDPHHEVRRRVSGDEQDLCAHAAEVDRALPFDVDVRIGDPRLEKRDLALAVPPTDGIGDARAVLRDVRRQLGGRAPDRGVAPDVDPPRAEQVVAGDVVEVPLGVDRQDRVPRPGRLRVAEDRRGGLRSRAGIDDQGPALAAHEARVDRPGRDVAESRERVTMGTETHGAQ